MKHVEVFPVFRILSVSILIGLLCSASEVAPETPAPPPPAGVPSSIALALLPAASSNVQACDAYLYDGPCDVKVFDAHGNAQPQATGDQRAANTPPRPSPPLPLPRRA